MFLSLGVRLYIYMSTQMWRSHYYFSISVYLQSDPKTVMKRIRKRGRREEAHITMEFLEGLHTLHEDWLVHKNTTFRMPSEK
jgi:deoxyadenosine/deoxycytidine kinase